jgi:type I restriction-modification system DNA methylase subunit
VIPKTIRALANAFPAEEDTGPLMRAIVNLAAQARGLTPPWLTPLPAGRTDVAAKLLADAGDDLAEWGAPEFGPIYEGIISARTREKLGAWYTPPIVAESMVSFTIGPQLDRFAAHPDPGNLLQVLALDPSCGAGIFLVSAARLIARRYAGRIGRTEEPTAQMIRMVMPEVMSECIFGIDIDPIAVDMAKAACWLEMAGTQPIRFMDRNITCGNAMNNQTPPKLDERYPYGSGVVFEEIA